MIAAVIMDFCLFFLLVTVALGMTFVSPAACAVSALLAVGSIICSVLRDVDNRKLGTGDSLLLFSVLILLSGTRVGASGGVLAWMTMGIGLVSLLAGIVMSLRAWRDGLWETQRTSMIFLVGIALSAISAMVFIAWGVLELRSNSGMSPGKMDFLFDLVLWAAVWFGLDSRLRIKKTHPGLGRWSWIIKFWRQLAVLWAASLIFVYSTVL